MDGFSFPFCDFFFKETFPNIYSRHQQIMTYRLTVIFPRNILNMEQDRDLTNAVDTKMS